MEQYPRVAATVTILLFLLCGSACQPFSPAQQKIILPTATPTPLFSVDFDRIPPATLQSPLPWKVEIVQDNKVVEEQAEEMQLAKRPFTIRVTLPQPLTIMLNVLDNDSHFQVARAGLHTDCPTPFCPGSAMAEDDYYHLPTNLIISEDGFHLLGLDTQGENWYRWNRATITRQGIVLERDVSRLNDFSLEQFPKARLYLVFFVDYRDHELINDDELKKLILHFN